MSLINHVKRQYPTAKQKCRLVQLLKSDPELRSGRFSATLTMQVAAERWHAIAEELNAIVPGAKKSGVGWRKTWTDMKSNSKKKFASKKIKKQSADADPLLESISDRWSSCHYDDPLLNGEETESIIKVKIEPNRHPMKPAECFSPEPVREFVTS